MHVNKYQLEPRFRGMQNRESVGVRPKQFAVEGSTDVDTHFFANQQLT
jgi:hypothetical protein